MAKKEDTHTSAIALQFTEQYGPVGVGPAHVARYLERQGLLKHDTGDSYLTAQAVDAPDDDPPHHLLEGQLLAGSHLLSLQELMFRFPPASGY